MSYFMVIVDGGYSEWSEFTDCSVSCGGGIKTRSRTCTNPVPKYFGRNCSILGLPVETLKCQTQPCPSKRHINKIIVAATFMCMVNTSY